MAPRIVSTLRSSIGKKLVLAVSGLLLIGFLIVHLAGNLTLLADGDGTAFDAYVEKLEGIESLVWVAEIGLVALFAVHIATAYRVSMENREARKQRYQVRASRGQLTVASASMLITGSLVLVFLVLHLIDFRFDERFDEAPAQLVVRTLSQPFKALVYLLALVALTIHLSHAFRSALQSLGVNHPHLQDGIRKLGLALAILLGLGFASIPVFLLFR